MIKLFCVLAAGMVVLTGAAQAQSAFGSSGTGSSSTGGSSSRMWGTTSSTGSAADSASMHAQEGTVAGQVDAAKAGLLDPANISITSVGSQNIVSTTVYGNNNTTNVNTTQTSSNSGNVINHGTITQQP
jgi:hypothetical protein